MKAIKLTLVLSAIAVSTVATLGGLSLIATNPISLTLFSTSLLIFSATLSQKIYESWR